MDKFIHLPENLLNKLFDCLNSSQTLSNELITDEIERILKEVLSNIRNVNQSSTATNSGLQESSDIYSFLLNCFVDLKDGGA